MTKDSIFGVIRHILTFGGGFLVAKDIIPADQLDTVIGAIITLVGAVWSIADKETRK